MNKFVLFSAFAVCAGARGWVCYEKPGGSTRFKSGADYDAGTVVKNIKKGEAYRLNRPDVVAFGEYLLLGAGGVPGYKVTVCVDNPDSLAFLGELITTEDMVAEWAKIGMNNTASRYVFEGKKELPTQVLIRSVNPKDPTDSRLFLAQAGYKMPKMPKTETKK